MSADALERHLATSALPLVAIHLYCRHENQTPVRRSGARRSWPADWQEELATIAFDIDAQIKDGVYHPTPEELAGIDRGLRDAEQSRFATGEEVEAAFAKFRGK